MSQQRPIRDKELRQQAMRQTMARLGGKLSFGVSGIKRDVCQCCHELTQVSQVPCRTAYHDNKQNVSPVRCEGCAQDYNECYDEMWDSLRG